MTNEENSFLEEVSKLFLKYGIKSLTMDDIARELGISKKTIYSKVKDKAELVEKVMLNRLAFEQQVLDEVFEQDLNSIDELFQICRCVGDVVEHMHPSVLFDLNKYYPKIWKHFQDHKQDFILRTVKDNLNKGKKNGIFRDDFNSEIIARIYIAKMELIFDGSTFDRETYNPFEVYLQMLIYHIRGVANEKGLEILDKKLIELKLKK